MTIIKSWIDKLIIISICVLIFSLPFSKSAIEACVIVAFVLWILKNVIFCQENICLANLFRPINSPFVMSLVLFIFAGLLSTVNSVSLSLSLKGLFLKLLEGVFLCFVIADTVNNEKDLKIVFMAIFASILLICTDGIFQLIIGKDFLRHYDNLGRISASFINPNGFGGWLTVMLPLSLGVIYATKDKRYTKTERVFSWILGILTMLCLVFTLSRGAFVGVAVSLLFFAFFKKNKISFILSATILALSLFIVSNFMGAHPNFSRIENENAHLNTESKLITLKSDAARALLWREAISIARDFPVFGCGINTYSVEVFNYKSSASESGIYPHNSYLQMLAEMGIFGLLSFIFVVISLFAVSLKNIKLIKDSTYFNILLGLLAGLSGFLIHSFFDVHFYALQLVNLMWFTMGLIVAVQKVALSVNYVENKNS